MKYSKCQEALREGGHLKGGHLKRGFRTEIRTQLTMLATIQKVAEAPTRKSAKRVLRKLGPVQTGCRGKFRDGPNTTTTIIFQKTFCI